MHRGVAPIYRPPSAPLYNVSLSTTLGTTRNHGVVRDPGPRCRVLAYMNPPPTELWLWEQVVRITIRILDRPLLAVWLS